ncbi:Mitochondrial ATPase complex subunit ATP10 [Hypsizygus marmoreus]|uniref:Mitochondrial ATPase complex subunit ATP10 n=1 Tax=Hypsizygus marmoreus TaxID=39966 RepID=A0A369KGA5_HYPMA|nr:Mitochondrial ATPase complex subunit ATP10 [Hypsizygus marmoreus]
MSFLPLYPVRSLSRHQTHLASVRRSFGSTCMRLKDSTEDTSQARLQREIEGPEVKAVELQPLNRPLGVTERPTTLIKTRTQKMKELMDSDVRMAQRRHLIKEAGKGYFHDMNMTRRHGGKTWIAPKVLIREDKALYLPNIVGKSLDAGQEKNTTTMCYGRITVLAMLGTRISEIHAKGFVDPTNARFSSHPLYQYVQINLQENLLKSILVNLFLNSLRSVVPEELQPNYLVSSQNMEYVRDPLGMTNSKVGYVYLIDENLKVRWGGCADATPEETQALEVCTGVLLKRAEKTVGNKGQKAKEIASEGQAEQGAPS